MPIELFPDQLYIVSECLRLTNNGSLKDNNVLVSSPSGSGKTYTITGLVTELLNQGFRQEEMLIVVPTYEIADQIDKRLKEGLDTKEHFIDILGSVKASNMDDLESPNYKIIIIDEAHHSEADTYKEIMSKWSNAVVYGFTATPMRNDDRELSDTYKHMVSGLTVNELIKAKRLAQYDYYQPDHDDVSTFDSEYLHLDGKNYSSLKNPQKLTRTIYGDIVDNWLEKASDRRTIAFTSTIDESKLLADTFKIYGIRAEHVDGSQMDYATRAKIIEDFRNGHIQVLCNQGLISEGFDVPDTSCVILARPTKSVILYLQQCFRAMRIGSDPNQRAIILDHANNISRFGNINADRGWSLTMDQAQKALAKNANKKKKGVKSDKPYDLEYNTISDAEMINLANVKHPQFEKDVEKALSISEGTKSFKELSKIQTKYKIKSPSNTSMSWAYMMALHFNKIQPLV